MAILTNDQKIAYRDDGLIRVTLPDSVVEILIEFRYEVVIWLNKFGNIDIDPNKLSIELPIIAKKNRQLVAKLYKVSRRFPSVRRLACDDIIVDISAELMDTKLVSLCNFTNIRIDLPNEDKYLLPAHQDFPYIQESLNGVTWWIPFFDIPVDSGAPTFCYGSHKDGILNVREFSYGETGKSGGKSFEIIGTKYNTDSCFSKKESVSFGSALVFNTLLVHRSEPNNSSVARFNSQIRLGDTLQVDSFNRNYPDGLYVGNKFSESYPEYVE